MSETMSEQNPKSPYRRMVGHHGPMAPSSLGVVSHEVKTEDLLEAAKNNIHMLKEKEEKSDRKVGPFIPTTCRITQYMYM